MDIKPKQITKDSDNGIEIASFGFYEGIAYAEYNNLKRTTSFDKVLDGTHYLVCCGEVMVLTNHRQWRDIPRRIL